MRNKSHSGQVWAIVALAVVLGCLHLLFFAVLSIDTEFESEHPVAEIGVRYVGDTEGSMDEVLLEELVLLDSTPLFMPTRWNAASDLTGLASLSEAVEAFSEFSPTLQLPGEALPSGAMVDSNNFEPKDFVPTEPGFFVNRYFGKPLPKADVSQVPEFKLWFTLLDRSQPIDPALSVDLDIDVESRWPTGLWQQIQGYLQIVDGRPVGPPVLQSRSGYPEWDQYIVGRILSSETYGHLKDGYYRLAVYP